MEPDDLQSFTQPNRFIIGNKTILEYGLHTFTVAARSALFRKKGSVAKTDQRILSWV